MAEKVQAIRSIRFKSSFPSWNGDVAYKTEGQLLRAAKNVVDYVPARVLQGAVISVRGGDKVVKSLEEWLR